MRFSVPIRWKIVGLVSSALVVSLLSYLYVGTSLIIEDKTSYIYDHNLNQVRSAGDAIERRIAEAGRFARVLGAISGDAEAAERFYRASRESLGIDGAVLLKPRDAENFSIERALGRDGGELKLLFAQMGWKPSDFERVKLLVGPSSAGRLPIGLRAQDASGAPVAVFFSLFFAENSVGPGSQGFYLSVLDSRGNQVFSSGAMPGGVTAQVLSPVEKSIRATKLDSGARDWQNGSERFIAAYQRVADGNLTVISHISKAEAFTAANSLTRRSVVLGVSILLLAFGFTLIFVRTLTARLRQMWLVTQRVASGDFSCRVDTNTAGDDEITGLGVSFNTMAAKIDELMAQTAEKARMEKELQTAELVQNQFFPASGFTHGNFRLSGKSVPASECAGDWWNYCQIGDELVIGVGDVTGHGVSSALVTAAAHGAFSVAVHEMKARPSVTPDITRLVKQLNQAVLSAGHGAVTMTFYCAVLNLRTGLLQMVNASHCPPYIYRRGARALGDISSFKPLLGAKTAPLGAASDIEVSSISVQLSGGDMLFLYTDGLFERRAKDQEKIGKPAFLKSLEETAIANSFSSDEICTKVMNDTTGFFGTSAKDRPDDITLLVGTVPPEAGFGPVAAPAKAA